MKRRIRSFLIFLLSAFVLLGISVSLSLTQSNDPNVNPDANACLPGGVMADTCTADRDVNGDGVVNHRDTNYLWRCGWYKIRVNHEMLDESVLDQRCEKDTPEPVVTATDESDDDDDDDNNNDNNTPDVEETEEVTPDPCEVQPDSDECIASLNDDGRLPG